MTSPLEKEPTAIPKIIHRVWLGPKPLSRDSLRFEQSFRVHNPDWELRLWTEKDIRDLPHFHLLERAKSVSSQANIVRVDVILLHGGIYVDTDVECLRPLDCLLNFGAFVGLENPSLVCNAVFGSTPGHDWLVRISDQLEWWADLPPPWGPRLHTVTLGPDVKVLPVSVFYPWLWNENPRKPGPNSLLAHYWDWSWRR